MIICLDKNYQIELSENDRLIINDLESIIDSLIYLLKSYGIEDEEIIDTIKSDNNFDIEEVE